MSAAAVEEPMEQPTLLEAAELIANQFAGHRVEIVGSQITVTPPPNASHGKSLSRLMRVLFAAGLDGDEVEVLQNVGIWLPDGPSDYAVPDLSIVDADIDDHLIEYNCYDPAIFRLVLEVTSSNLSDDLKKKPFAYASAGVPVYVIVDRTNQRVMVLTDPEDGEYRVHAVHHPGQSFTLPESIGAAVTLSVDDVLAAKK
ncbi:Uma2 family endonuclease [Kitasatospora sp. CM 4170]|uniref:Uma2 family endonuclease n=1 Tax=Kitasatospora aburaviensis TaxID=67265 RepID=A0ABW1EZ30_9ACTN|nr:Uma2 family endonuclease [Kitasatospora sp. CM 4170]WNM45006.1 Uma2 family endonuclease [Kitasatospora sp. CM 4170]